MLKDMLNWALALASPVVFLATLIGTIIWSASSVVNNTYGRDIGWIALLAMVGYVLAIVFLSFLGGGFPGDKRDYHEKASGLFKGFLAKGAGSGVFVIFYLWCTNRPVHRDWDNLRVLAGRGHHPSWDPVLECFLLGGAVGVSFLTLGAILLNHWSHLLLFIEWGSSCDGYYHWFDDEQEEVGRAKA